MYPGPDHPSHLEALLRVVDGRPLKAIICTPTHRDHSPASRPLQQATGAPILGCAPLVLDDDGPRADASFDSDYAPNAVLSEGEAVQGEGWRLEKVATPGHTSNHLCFGLPEEKALLPGAPVKIGRANV